MPISLNSDAVFIADAHENKNRKNLYKVLEEVDALEPSQLFLVGDIFDLLVAEVVYTKELYKKEIFMINKLALRMQIFYFEGNHDFSLQSIFPNVTVYKRSEQPVTFLKNNKITSISHGDIFENFGYNIYTAVIRNTTLLKLLNFIDIHTRNFISKSILEKLSHKQQCRKYEDKEHLAKKRILNYTTDALIIEGHFHQDFTYKNYINLPSLSCNKKLFKLID